MLKKLVILMFFILFIFLPQSIQFHIPFAVFVNQDKLFSYLKDKAFLTYKPGNMIAFAQEKVKSLPVENYLDFSEKGFYVTYDKIGNDIQLFYQENVIQSWKNQSKYPRIDYPFVFLFSSDMSKAEVYSMIDIKEKPVAVIHSSEMFTSWKSSPDGGYFILGDLSGKAFIYHSKEKKVIPLTADKSKNNYIKGVHIGSNGEYCFLGGVAPELLYIGNVFNDRQRIYSIPPSGRSRRLIYNFSQYLVIEKNYGVFIVNKNTKTIKEHNINYKLYDGKEINYKGENFLVLLMREGTTTRIEIFSENNYQYSLWINSQSLPKIEHRHKKVLIVWEEGAVEI